MRCCVTNLAEIYGDPIFFGSGPGFVNRTQSDPGFVNPVQVSSIRSDPIRSWFCQRPVRSLLGNMDQLRLFCERNGADIITLSKTWLNKGIDDSEIELPGYSIIRLDRSERTGGGVIIYIREGLVFTERNDLHNNNEAIWIQVNRTQVNRSQEMLISQIDENSRE